MKKWVIILAGFVLGVCGFAIISNLQHSDDGFCRYKQTLYYNEQTNVLDGKETINFYNYTDNVLKKLCLHLYPNAFRQGANASVVSLANYEKAFPNGKSYGEINIETVSSGSEYLTYEITGSDNNILKIDINELYPGDRFEFEVGFSVGLANINHRLGYGNNTINLCNYYPIMCVYENGGFVTNLYNSNGDPFYSKIANYEVEISYSKELTLASSGVQKNVIDGDKKITKITANNVRDFAMVLSSKFSVAEEKYSNVSLLYYYYDDTNPKSTMTVIKNVLDMNKKYGMYPYETLSVVEANFVHGGMEYPNIVLISDDLDDYDTYINVVVHELCHQWWYGVVGNDQYNYGFLDEGLTDYNTARFYNEYKEYGHTSDEIFGNALKSYVNFAKIYCDVKENFSTNMIRPLDKFETENEYVYLTYVKGMLMFASLEEMLGTKKIDACLKYYFECNKFKEATPDDLIECFNKASGKNLTNFFTSWFDGNVVIAEF